MKSIKLSLILVVSEDKFKKLAEYEDGTVIYEEETRTIDCLTKSKLYSEGNYSCKLNIPVNHTGWDQNSWINWVDSSGRWWLDDCYWEKIKGEVDQYTSCRSSGFLNRYKKELDAALKKDE